MNKKIAAVLLCIAVALTVMLGLTACDKQDGEQVNMYVPDGAPALSVANLFEVDSVAGRKLNVTITTGNDVRAKVLSGEADVVICPTNMAATLYNAGADYKLVTANLFGLLYLVGNQPAVSLSDLVGQVVHCIGKNNTPEFVLKKILDNANIPYVDSDKEVEGKVAIRYYEKGSQIIPLLKSNVAHYAILGEPAATKSGVNELFNLQELWKQATMLDESYPQAGLFVSNKLLEDGKFMKKLVELLNDNTQYVSKNSASVAQMLVDNGSVDFDGVTFNETIIARCNIRCVNALDCKAQMTAYFEAIRTVNSAFELPDDGFYAE